MIAQVGHSSGRQRVSRRGAAVCGVFVSAWLLGTGEARSNDPLAEARGAANQQRGELLYNGIQLPDQWPPRDGNPKSEEPMAVPYLQSRPAVVPIDVGRQLFVDDFLIERTTLKRTFHKPEKHAGNPVFQPETPHELKPSGVHGREQAVCYLGHGGVFFDPEAQHYKMFYTAGWRGGLALATSKDLIHWDRPELNLAGGNLLLAPGWQKAGGDNCVWLDTAAKDSAQRLKFMADHKPKEHKLYTSADGRKWQGAVSTGAAGDYCSFFHNPFRDVWVSSIKQVGPRGRSRWYAENRDFLAGADWKNAVYWTNADRLDAPDPEVGDPPQLYSLNAVAYESLLLGMFYIHRGPKNELCQAGKFPKITDLAIGFSRDGFHWDRPDREAFLAGTRKPGDWDRAYLHSTAGVCLVTADTLYFPYTAYSGVAPNGYRGMYTGAAVGLATLRRDGFASLGAGETRGELITAPVRFSGQHLFVNVACPQGELTVEVLDEAGKVIAPFTADRCTSVQADDTCNRVTWKGIDDLASLRGKTVRFRFRLTRGRLYAFWVSANRNGASNGYVAAGGPDYKGVRDVP